MLLSVFGVLLITIIQTVGVKTNFSMSGFYPVVSCPRNAFDWEASSQRLNCTKAHMYHCNPYEAIQLYEFCYEKDVFKVKKGHCLALTEHGILNQDGCHYFSQGCPSDDYYSNESYKYQSCLSINGKCYTEDRYCNCLEATAKPTGTYITKSIDAGTKPNDAYTRRSKTDTGSSGNQYKYLPGFIVTLVISFLSIGLNCYLWYKYKWKPQNERSGVDAKERNPLIRLAKGDEINKTEEETAMKGDEINKTEELQETVTKDNENITTLYNRVPNHSQNRLHDEHTMPLLSRLQSISENEIPQLYKMIFTSFTIEDTDLFRLLKQKCIIGSHPGFQYLVESRVKPNKKMDIFKQSDENGCFLIHFAAQGGSIAILDDIVEYGSSDLLRRKCIRGQLALHFAVKSWKYNMVGYLIKKMKHNEETKKEGTTSQETTDLRTNKQATNDDNHTLGNFPPVFLVSWIGGGRLLFTLKEAGFDMLARTKTGLNILHIACMSEKLKDNYSFCKNLLSNYENINPRNTDLSGWNVCHFASMSNFKVLQFIVNDPELCKLGLIMEKTESEKTCLHIACEYAQPEAVKLIVADFNSLIEYKDRHGWNALHFAAKGGNLWILEYLLKQNLDIGSLTNDRKTILHIACLEKHADICQYAVNMFTKELLNVQTREHKLTAVHYLGVQKKEPPDGSEEKILKIFCNSEMDLKALSCKGLTVLDRAIDHLDIEVIRCMVSEKYRDKCGVSIPVLSKYLHPEFPINNEIKTILEKACQEMQYTSQVV